MKYKVQIYAYYPHLLRHVFTMAQYCSISFNIVRSNSSIVYVSDGCCSPAWLVALSALWFSNETGSFPCVCVRWLLQFKVLYIKSIKASSKSNTWSKKKYRRSINIVSEPDVPIGFLNYYNRDKRNKSHE